MSRNLCPSCHGTGEGAMLAPGFGDEYREVIGRCYGCHGSGFERSYEFKSSRAENQAAMDAAVRAISQPFGGKRA